MAAFWSASRQQKYAVASIDGGYRPTPVATISHEEPIPSTAGRSASATPPASSRGGKMPRASRTSVAIASAAAPLLLREQGVRAVERAGRERPGEPEVHGERDQVLLRAVVDVALQAPALGVVRVHEPLA